jgi:hypothetical protein
MSFVFQPKRNHLPVGSAIKGSSITNDPPVTEWWAAAVNMILLEPGIDRGSIVACGRFVKLQ